LQGGKFGHGFVSAGLSAIGGQFIKGANWIKKGVGKTVAKITLGGTISKITGGKFANGAAGAAFAMVVQSVGAGLASTSVVEKSGSNQTSDVPIAERQAAAQKEVLSLVTDETIDPKKVFTGDSALGDAATEVLGAVHPISEKYNLEIAGRLVANGEGVSYGLPSVGGETSARINPVGALGGYHTHPGGTVYSYFSNQYTSASRASGDAGWVEINKIPLFMSNQGSSINISVCSPGSPRCRTDFDPRLYGINRGISGIPIN
jgi:hypothetical protein